MCVGKGVHARARERERETHMSSVCTGCGLALWFGVAVLILRGCARVAALICDGLGSQNVRKGWREVPAPVRRAGCSNAHLGRLSRSLVAGRANGAGGMANIRMAFQRGLIQDGRRCARACGRSPGALAVVVAVVGAHPWES